MIDLTAAMRTAVLLLLATAVLGFGWLAADVRIAPRPRLGHRGAQRRKALEEGGSFAAIEPAVRFIAGVVATLPLEKLRAEQESELRRADHPLGLMPDELSALSLIAALVLGMAGWFLSVQLEVSRLCSLIAAAFGLLLPTIQLREVIRRRNKEISRGLPHAIEIVAMCMGAGHDFPGAVRLVAAPQGKQRTALSRELHVVLEHLELGHTRREALLSFAARVRTEAVRDFVNAVIQAEQRGNPLAKVIQVQGRMLNMRRSVAAEEAAARAAVMMVAPMLVLVCCVLLLLVGPFVVKGIGF
jgi:tight adherence protein C